jgi:hypothetical protein
MSESRSTFFRQSAWLGASTLASGALMTVVHTVASKLNESEYSAFGSMLRLFLLLGMPTAGVQVVFARQAAAALNSQDERTLASTTRGVLWGSVAIWFALLVGTVVARDALARGFDLSSTAPLWPTIGMTLTWLVLPVFRGLLQGRQNFTVLGWVSVLDAAGRFGSIALLVTLGRRTASDALAGAWFGQLLATGLAVWSTRDVWMGPGGPVRWRRWFRQVIPLSLVAGGLLVLANFDYPFLTWMVPSDRKEEFSLGTRYFPASMVGFALTQVTVPLAMVMFPKISRSAAAGQKTDTLLQALAATAGLGAVGAFLVTFLPELPLRIIFLKSPDKWAAAPLVPWLVWAMLAYALANVLVSNLIARSRWDVVPWVVFVAVGYILAFRWMVPWLLQQSPTGAYQAVALLVGGANALLLLIAVVLTRRQSRVIDRSRSSNV